MELLFENPRTNVNLLLGLTLANYITTRCVNLCRLVSMLFGIRETVVSRLEETKRLWTCLFFNEQDQNVELKASIQEAERKKVFASVSMGFVSIETLCSRPWAAFITFVPVKSLSQFPLKNTSNVAIRRERSLNWNANIYRKKASRSSNCRSVGVGDCTRQPVMLNYISGKTSSVDVHKVNKNFWKT